MRNLPPSSVRFSTTPALRLEIGRSRWHGFFGLACLASAVYSLCLVASRGHLIVAIVLVPIAAVILAGACRDGLVGKVLIGDGAGWSLDDGNDDIPVQVHRASVALPWCIYLVLVDLVSGRRQRGFLFPDCASRDQLRRLRVRLRVQR